MSIQWYPGHMAKAKREVAQNLKLVDVAVELVDARIPQSSRNPDLNELLSAKDRIIAMNKIDLADHALAQRWSEWFASQGIPSVGVNSRDGAGMRELTQRVTQIVAAKNVARSAKGKGVRPARILVVGIPNVGKSSLINRLSGRSGAKTGDKPGVTRAQQWIRVGPELELLDTPGVLWPKIVDAEVSFRLAVTGAIDERLFNVEAVALHLVGWLVRERPGLLTSRFGMEWSEADQPENVLAEIGRRRGCLLPGNVIDLPRAGAVLINEFKGGKLGPVTMEAPPA